MLPVSFTYTLSAKTVNSLPVAYTSNEVWFVFVRYLSSPRYSPLTSYNPISTLSRCSKPLPSFTYTMYDLISSTPSYKDMLTLPVASTGTSTVMLT